MLVRRVVTLMIGTLIALAGMASAEAGPPANHACLGTDSSGAARALAEADSSLGSVVGAIATAEPQSIGHEVQAHLAGEIPDEVFANTCND